MAFLSSLVKWGHNRRYNEGILHFNRGEFERAAECFESVLREVPDPNDPDHCLALVHAAEALEAGAAEADALGTGAASGPGPTARP